MSTTPLQVCWNPLMGIPAYLVPTARQANFLQLLLVNEKQPSVSSKWVAEQRKIAYITCTLVLVWIIIKLHYPATLRMDRNYACSLWLQVLLHQILAIFKAPSVNLTTFTAYLTWKLRWDMRHAHTTKLDFVYNKWVETNLFKTCLPTPAHSSCNVCKYINY